MRNSINNVLLLLLLLFSTLIRISNSKTVKGTTKLTGEKTEHTIFKFAISPNTKGKFHAVISTKTSYKNYDKMLKLFFYSGENIWSKVKKLPTCEEKIKLSTFEKTIQLEPYKASSSLSNGDNNEYHYKYEVTTGLMTNLQYPDYWYVTISDCSLELYYHEGEQDSPSIHYVAQIYNQYEKGVYSHVSYDQRYMKAIHTITLITSCVILIIVIMRCVRINQIQHEIHIGCIIVIVLTIMQILSTSCQYIHLIRYEYDGIGYYTFDALSAYFESIVDSIMSLLLLAISSGWTLPNDIIISSPNRNILQTSLRSTQSILAYGNPIASIFLCSIFAIHFILAQWGRIYNDDFDSYHDLEHLPGKILFIFRLLLGLLFLYNISSLRYKSVHMTTSLSTFYIYFALLGLAWFITIPLCAFLFVSTLLYSYQRHYIVECICCFMQSISLYSMTWLFFFGWDLNNDNNSHGTNTDKKTSAFHKISKVGIGRDNIDSTGSSSLFEKNNDVGQSMIKFGKTKIRLD